MNYEWVIVQEKTIKNERAIFEEKTTNDERAKIQEKTKEYERAIGDEKTMSYERKIKKKENRKMSKKVRLMDLIQAPELQVREVNPVVVGNYSESIKAGAVFPPIIIDEKNRIICGNHRYSAYKKNYEPDALIECEIVKGKSDVELIMIAAGDNSKNGWPLTTFEKKSISLRLIKDHKIDPEKVSSILGVRVDRVEEWAGMTVVVVGGDGKRKEEPIKRGFENMVGSEVSEQDYKNHKNHDYGVSLRNICSQIISIIKRDSVWVTDEPALRELYSELKTYFNKKGE